uniref:Uncharacterized protein n=1 Tax=Tanacetum cinerariifolium TaxID=118510 RepID=A0A699IKE4_TANCI|nr:hypothetical protein [Tanacetum cinerariifolium]
MSYLIDYREIDGGYVAFGGNPKGGKITKNVPLKLFVTDDYSRFTWVFFLATKDETSGILKSFITRIENLVDHKRRNKTLIKDTRTMLADFKLPTTFLAEAVNTACYVQNRVLVVKPHNKTSYELFHGTQSNSFAGTKASYNACQARKETEPVKDYILLPLWTTDLPFSQDPKSSHDDGSKPLSDDGKSSTIDAAGTNKDNELPLDPNMPALEDVSIFNFSSNDEDDGRMADMNNLDTRI